MRLVTVLFAALLAFPAVAAELQIPEDGYAVSDDVSLLPQAVRDKRAELLAAAKSGDIAKLKAIFDTEAAPPTVSFGEPDDPIKYLIEQSADGKGMEMLAIMANLLSAPYAAIDGGDGDPIYVWPYLAAFEDFDSLTPEQIVDGYRLLGHAGFENERELGNWLSWRLFISVRGELQAFVAGD